MKNKIKKIIKKSWLAICYGWQFLSRGSHPDDGIQNRANHAKNIGNIPAFKSLHCKSGIPHTRMSMGMDTHNPTIKLLNALT